MSYLPLLSSSPKSLKNAEAYWDARLYNPGLTPQYLKDASGHGHHMKLGSVGRGDVIDGALVLPGSNTSFARVEPNATRIELLSTASTSFEDGSAQAGQYGNNPTIANSSDFAYAGTKSLKITSTTAGNSAIFIAGNGAQSMSCTPNVQYSFRVRIYTTLAGRTASAQLIWRDNADAYLNITASSNVSLTQNAWTTIVIHGVALSNAEKMRVAISFGNVSAAGESYYIDDLSVWRSDTDFDIEGDMEWQLDLTRDSTSAMVPMRRANAHWWIYLSGSTNTIHIVHNVNGAAAVDNTIVNSAWPVGLGERVKLRITRVAATGLISVYYRLNDSDAWIATGTHLGPEGTYFQQGSSSIEIGTAGSFPHLGRIHRAILKSGIDGATVLDVNFSGQQDGCAWFNEAKGKKVSIYPLHAVVLDGKAFFPGVVNNYISTPDHPSLEATTELDVAVRLAPEKWQPAASETVIAKYGSGGNRSWRLYLNGTSGTPAVSYYPSNGGAEVFKSIASAFPFTDGQTGWIRFTADSTSVKFYWALDSEAVPENWTTLGTSSGGVGTIFNSSVPLELGMRGVGTVAPFTGKIYRAIFKTQVNGPTVFDCDFANWHNGEGVAFPKVLSSGHIFKVHTDLSGADTNDPTFLPYEGEQYVYFPGTLSNYINIPDSNLLTFQQSTFERSDLSTGWTNDVRTVTRGAEAYWNVKDYNPGTVPQYLPDGSGNGHHMRLGSVGRADVLDGALVLPGGSGNYALSPNTTRTELITTGTGASSSTANFETAQGGWFQYGTNSNIARDLTVFRTGTASLKISSIGTGIWYVTSPYSTTGMSVTEGVQYSSRVFVRPDITRNMRTMILWFTAAGASITNTTSPIQSCTGGVWTAMTNQGVAPANAAFACLVVYSNDAALGAGEYYNIDDVSFWRSDADLSIEGDIEIQSEIAADSYRPAATQVIGGKESLSGDRSYLLFIQTTGVLVFQMIGPDGTAYSTSSTTTLPDTGGARLHVKVTRRAYDGRVQYFTGTTKTGPWTQLGADVTIASGINIRQSNSGIEIGNRWGGTSLPFAGRIYNFIIRSGIDGPVVFDADFSGQKNGIPWFNESTGKRVTIYPQNATVVSGEFYQVGLNNNYAQLANSEAAFYPTGDIDIKVVATPDRWGRDHLFVSRWGNGFAFGTNAAGNLRWWQIIGGSATFHSSTVVLPLVDYTEAQVRVTRVAATGTVTFFYRLNDSESWQQLGSTVSTPVGAIDAVVTSTAIGAQGGGGAFMHSGRIKRVQIAHVIDGTSILDCNFSEWRDGDGVATPKQISTGQYIKIVTDSGGADSNDPTYLPYEGTKYTYHTGVNGNYIFSPNKANQVATGQLDLVGCVALDDWTPSAFATIVSKYTGTSSTNSYRMGIVSGGQMQGHYSDGTTDYFFQSANPIPVLDGQHAWCRFTWRNTDGQVYMYYSLDPVTTAPDQVNWTVLYSTTHVTSIGKVVNPNGVAPIEIGSRSSGVEQVVGKIYRAQIRTTINGSAVFDYDPSTLTEPYRVRIDSENLFDKDASDLEDGIGGFIQRGTGQTFSRETVAAYSGNYGIRVTATASPVTDHGANWKSNKVKAGSQYSFSVRVRTQDASTNSHAYIYWRDGSGATVTAELLMNNVTGDGTWQLRTRTITAPAGADWADVVFNTLSPSKYVDFDEFGMWESPTVPAWTPGGSPLLLTRTATGKKLTLVDRTMFLFGSDDFMECSDHSALDMGANQAYSASLTMRRHHQGIAYTHHISKNSWRIESSDAGTNALRTVYNRTIGGIASPANHVTDYGKVFTTGFRRIIGSGEGLQSWYNQTFSSVGGLSSSDAANDSATKLTIGRNSNDSGGGADMEFFGASIWKEALVNSNIELIESDIVNDISYSRSTTTSSQGLASLSLVPQIVAGQKKIIPLTMATTVAYTQYTAVVDIKSSVSRQGRVDIAWFDVNGKYISTSKGTAVATSTSFFQHSVTATSPVGGVKALPVVVIENADPTDTHYIDRASIHAGAGTTWVPSLTLTDSMELFIDVALDDWTPSGQAQGLISKCTANRSFRFQVDQNGAARFEWWPTGTASPQLAATSSALPLLDGQRAQLKVNFQGNNGLGGYTVTFNLSTNGGTTWTNIGTTTTTSGTTSLAINNPPIELGSMGFAGAGLNALVGKIYSAYIKEAASGITVASFAASDIAEPHTTVTSSEGHVISMVRTTTGKKLAVVSRPVFLFGSDDWMECPDHEMLDFPTTSYALGFVCRIHNLSSGLTSYFDKFKFDSSALPNQHTGWALRQTSNSSNLNLRMWSGTVPIDLTLTNPMVLGTTNDVIVSVTRPTGPVITYTNEVQVDSDATFSAIDPTTTENLRIGNNRVGTTSWSEFEFMGAAIWRTTLSLNQAKGLKKEWKS